MKTMPNKPAAGNAGITPQLAIAHRRPGVPEPERYVLAIPLPDRFLMAACEKGDVGEVVAALDAGADPNATNAWSGLAHMQGSALMRAAKHGYVEIARVLLERGAKVEARDGAIFSETALHCAAAAGHVDMAHLLIEWGANPDSIDVYGKTALHCAAANAKYEMVRFLIEVGVAIDPRDCVDNTPLDIASLYEDTSVADLLREHGAKGSRRTEDRSIDRSLLTRQLSAEEAELKYRKYDRWKRLASQYQEGDEFWEYSSSDEDWQMGMGQAGIILLRGGTCIEGIVTDLD